MVSLSFTKCHVLNFLIDSHFFRWLVYNQPYKVIFIPIFIKENIKKTFYIDYRPTTEEIEATWTILTKKIKRKLMIFCK